MHPYIINTILSIYYALTYIKCMLKRLSTLLLRLTLCLPEHYIPSIRNDITILVAKDDKGYYVTNKLNLYMYYVWDRSDTLDIYTFCKYIGTSTIFIAYTLPKEKLTSVKIVTVNIDKVILERSFPKKIEPLIFGELCFKPQSSIDIN